MHNVVLKRFEHPDDVRTSMKANSNSSTSAA